MGLEQGQQTYFVKDLVNILPVQLFHFHVDAATQNLHIG